MSTTPPDSLQPYIALAESLRDAAASHDYATLGRLVTDTFAPDLVTVMVYVTSPLGHLTIVGSYIQLWLPLAPDILNREPSLEEMALVLRAAARR
jgi:hypothetical protein